MYPSSAPLPQSLSGIQRGQSTAPMPYSISADAHQFTGDWIFSKRIAGFRPFALAGIGFIINKPTGYSASNLTLTNIATSTTAVYVYGAGIGWQALSHLGLRLQYRGNIHKLPNFNGVAVNGYLHTAEPMLGLYYRF